MTNKKGTLCSLRAILTQLKGRFVLVKGALSMYVFKIPGTISLLLANKININ